MTSASDSKKYDGTPLTNDNVVVSGSGFVDGEGATFTVTGSQTAVGSSLNTYSYKLNEGTNTADYSITTVEGTLTVYVADAITITADSSSKMYDGTELADNGYTVSGKLGAGDYVSVTVTGTITNAGSVANKVTGYAIYSAGGQDVTDCYAQANLVDGTLTVTKRAVEITSGSATKVYDETPLTKDSTMITAGDGFIGSESYTASVTGSQIGAGSSKNVFTISAADGTDFNNYEITKVEGDLTVTKAQAVLHVHSADNIEEIVFDASKVDANGYYEMEIRNFSEFAFIYEQDSMHRIIAALLVLFLAFVAVLWFCLKIRSFKKDGKLSLVAIIGFAVELVATAVLAFFAACTLCWILIACNGVVLAVGTGLYLQKTLKNE